jgi:hypothetical protein
MKTKLLILLLGSAAAAFGQHGGAGGRGGAGMPGMGASSHSGGGSGMGRANDGSRPANTPSMGKQSPDQALSRNNHLSSKLDKLLPNGMTAQQACSGFKNLGQCVAAIHVSHNLSIPFDDLKAKMTGTGSESLGKAIHQLKPATDGKAEAKRGQKQADEDLRSES